MSGDEQEGQVSEVQRMDPADADTPISDSQSVDGQPGAESGEVQEGHDGPNATTGHADPDEKPDR